jgi:hypothetical protein
MKEGLIDKIKSNGYWRINFQPLVDSIKLKSIDDCAQIVEKNSEDRGAGIIRMFRNWKRIRHTSRDRQILVFTQSIGACTKVGSLFII